MMQEVPSGSKSVKESILVVDDDPSMCSMLASVLETEGYRPVSCLHPSEALAASSQEHFNLAFVDINLPDMDGLTLASTLKDMNAGLEIVFITGFGTFDNAVQAIKLGAYDYLRKPFNISELTLCLRRLEEKKALQKRISQAEQRYFELVQNIPLLIFVLQKDFSLEFVNQACLGMLGYAPDDVIHKPGWFLGRVHPDDRDRIREIVEKSFLSEGLPLYAECRFLHKKEHVIHGIITSIPSSRGAEDIGTGRLDGIVVDISDRVLLEKTLVQSEKLKTLATISAEVAHEIRNPLTSIGGFARRMKKKIPGLPEPDIILRESERLEKLLDRIRSYLKPVKALREECSLNEVIRDCLDILSADFERMGITFDLNADNRLPLVWVDPEIIQQVFVNLIQNAIERMEAGDNLAVKTYESSQNVHVDFRSRMREPATKDLDLLFLPFDEEGQSLGLPLCYRVIKNMGGLLTVTRSESEMVFTVSLPKPAIEKGEPQADGPDRSASAP